MAKGKAGMVVETQQVEQKAADALEQLISLTGTNDSDRKLLRTTLLDLLGYGRQGTKLLQMAEQVLRDEVEFTRDERKQHSEAERRDTEERRQAELEEKRKRLTVDLAQAKQHRTDEEGSRKRKDDRHREEMQEREAARKRKDERHRQEIRERETAREDASRERNLFTTLTAISVVATVFFAGCTMVFLFLTAKYSQPWGYAGSGASLALTVIIGLTGGMSQRLRALFSLAKSGGEGSDPEGQGKDP